MKSGKYIAVVAVLASGLSLSAFAKDKNETRITLSHSVQVGMTQLKPGDYKLQWDGSGSKVQVKFLKGKDVVATVPAKLEQAKNPQGTDAIETSDVSNVSTLIGLTSRMASSRWIHSVYSQRLGQRTTISE